MNNTTPTVETKIATPISLRKKSEETVLKQGLKTLNKDLVKIEKSITEYETMKKQMKDVDTQKTAIEKKIEIVKTKLIKILGLD